MATTWVFATMIALLIIGLIGVAAGSRHTERPGVRVALGLALFFILLSLIPLKAWQYAISTGSGTAWSSLACGFGRRLDDVSLWTMLLALGGIVIIAIRWLFSHPTVPLAHRPFCWVFLIFAALAVLAYYIAVGVVAVRAGDGGTFFSNDTGAIRRIQDIEGILVVLYIVIAYWFIARHFFWLMQLYRSSPSTGMVLGEAVTLIVMVGWIAGLMTFFFSYIVPQPNPAVQGGVQLGAIANYFKVTCQCAGIKGGATTATWQLCLAVWWPLLILFIAEFVFILAGGARALKARAAPKNP